MSLWHFLVSCPMPAVRGKVSNASYSVVFVSATILLVVCSLVLHLGGSLWHWLVSLDAPDFVQDKMEQNKLFTVG